MDTAILEKAKTWLQPEFDAETRQHVQDLIDSESKELTDAFYKDLEFGTGGLRGIMGPGSNRINRYTIGMATQGLVNYIKSTFSNRPEIKVAIAHDSRNNSDLFAKITADVFSANGIKVYLFEALRPTPELSFAIRHLNCQSGIVITASHNPKEYNGYKVYWQDGGQLVPPHDKAIIAEVRKITSPTQVNWEADPNSIHRVGKAIDQAYLDKLTSLTFASGNSDLKVVYTSIHGTGITLIPEAFERLGYRNFSFVEEQATPDGNFPTVHSPNPEESAALDLALKQAEESGADLVLGTDPDTDRVGLAVRDQDGKLVLINGNQAGSMLVHYLLTRWKEEGKLEGKEFVAKTVVTTELIRDIANDFGVECHDTLTGFKYIADLINRFEGEKQFIGGGEESYGYLAGDFVRDKDAVISSVLLAEVADHAKQSGSSFFDQMLDLYLKYGFYKEKLISITKKGKEGAEAIQAMMKGFRENPPQSIAGTTVSRIADYQTSNEKELSTGVEKPIDLPSSNVIQFFLEDGSKITARPSGTEPKIKFYFSIKGQLDSKANYGPANEQMEARLEEMVRDLNLN